MMRDLYSEEAEFGVIGSMLVDNNLIETIGAMLSHSHFYSEDAARLYMLCLQARSKGIKPDALSLASELEILPSGNHTMQAVAQIQMSVTNAANGEHYANIVLERHQARRLHSIGQQIVSLAKRKGSIVAQIAEAQALVMSADFKTGEPDVYQMHDGTLEVVQELMAIESGEEMPGVDIGLPDLDNIVRKFRPGTLNIIAGRPGSGKSLSANMIAINAAVTRRGGSLMFSLEMSKKELAKRMLSNIGSIDLKDFESKGALKGADLGNKLMAAGEIIKNSDMRICDKPGLSFERMCSIARYEYRVKPYDVMIVDYIGLVTLENNSRIQNRNQELGYISRGLKALSKELNVPIVALAQLNRGIEGRGDEMPKMSDLRDSGEIEQDADVIIINHRKSDEHGRAGLTMSEVVKVRHAAPGGTVIQMRGEYAKFVQADHHSKQLAYEAEEKKKSVKKAASDTSYFK